MLIAAVKLLELHAMLLVPDMTNGYILPSRFLEWVVKTSHDIIHVLTITNSNVCLYFMHTKENKNNSTAQKTYCTRFNLVLQNFVSLTFHPRLNLKLGTNIFHIKNRCSRPPKEHFFDCQKN